MNHLTSLPYYLISLFAYLFYHSFVFLQGWFYPLITIFLCIFILSFISIPTGLVLPPYYPIPLHIYFIIHKHSYRVGYTTLLPPYYPIPLHIYFIIHLHSYRVGYTTLLPYPLHHNIIQLGFMFKCYVTKSTMLCFGA
jgi:hypothetical protein